METEVKIPGLGDDGVEKSRYDFTQDVAEVDFEEMHRDSASGALQLENSDEVGIMSEAEDTDKLDSTPVVSATPLVNAMPLCHDKVRPEDNPTKEFLERVKTLEKEGIEHSTVLKKIETPTGEETTTFAHVYTCTICNCKLNVFHMAEIHVAGQRHKKLQQIHIKSVAGEDVADRYIDKILKTTTAKQQIVGLSQLVEYHDNTNAEETPIYSCKVCKIGYLADDLLKHLDGSRHKMAFLREIGDHAYKDNRYRYPGIALNNALGVALYRYKKSETPKSVQIKFVGHSEFLARKSRIEDHIPLKKRTLTEEVYTPSKKLISESGDVPMPVPAPGPSNRFQGPPCTFQRIHHPNERPFQYGGPNERPFQYGGPNERPFQYGGGPRHPFPNTSPYKKQNFNTPEPRFQSDNSGNLQAEMQPRNDFGPLLQTLSWHSRSNFSHQGLNFPTVFSNQGNNSAPIQNQGTFSNHLPPYARAVQSYSVSNSNTTACGITDHEKDIIHSLTKRKITSDGDAQFLMAIVKDLTQTLMQYRIRQMPPQLKETLLSTVVEGGTEALADLMH